MVKKSRRWGGPRPAPYNPNARDADGDGMVQEGTIWERPGGARFVNRLGKEIVAAAAAATPGSYIVNDRGERIDYTPSWQREGAPGDVDLSPAGGLPRLGDIGMPSIGETNGTIRDTMGTVEGPPEVPDLKPDPRDVDAPDVDRVSLPDGETATPQVPSLSGPEVEAARQRLAKEIATGAIQASNWTRSDGRSTGDGVGPEFAVEPIARFDLDDETTKKIAELGGTVFPVYEVKSDLEGATEFREAIQYAHDTHKFGTSVDVYPLKDYQGDGIRLFLSPDKKVGYAVKSDGQLVSVFNADDTTEMPLHTIVPLALGQGATRADAFDTVLPLLYSQFGLQPTARLPFDDDYKPDGWNYSLYDRFNNGKPDVVFMRLDPDRIGELYVDGDGPYVDDYDAGLATTADPPTIDIYPEEVAGKEGVYDAVNSLVEGQPDPEAGWVFTGSKEVIDGHGDAAEEAITSYVRNSIPINTDLRDGDISPENQETIDMFDELFEALPESEGGTVYRGAAMRTLLGDVDVESEEELDDLIEAAIGATIADDGILSTSTRPEVAVDFSHANRVDGEPEGYLVLEVDIPEGGKALGISNYPGRGESEVLLPRGAEYEVVSVQKIDKADGDHPTYVAKVVQKPRVDADEAVGDAVTDSSKLQAIPGSSRRDVAAYLGEGQPPDARPALTLDAERALEATDTTFHDPYEDRAMDGAELLGEYANDWASNVNLALRDPSTRVGVESGEDLFEKLDRPRIEVLDSIIDATSAEEPYTAYRGISGQTLFSGKAPRTHEEMVEKLESLVGETFSDEGYLSASMSSYEGAGFAEYAGELPLVLRIAVPEGSPGIYLGDEYGADGEEEVLLPRGLPLRVTGVHATSAEPTVVGGRTITTKPTYVMDVEVVQPGAATADDVTDTIEEALDSVDVPGVDTFEAAPELREAVDLYLPNETEINQMFDAGKMPEIEGQDEAELADKLPKLIEATTGELPEDTVIYRAGNSDEFEFDLGEDPQDLIGQEISSDGFMAGRTSELEPTSVDGDGYAYSLKIEASEGDLGAHVGEGNVVLPPGTRIEVTDVELVDVDGVERLEVTGKPITEKLDVEDAVSIIGGDVPSGLVDNMVDSIWKDTPKPTRQRPPNEVREVEIADGVTGKVEILPGLEDSLRREMLPEKERVPLQENAAKAIEEADKVTDYRDEEHELEGAADVVYDYTSGHMGSTVNGLLRQGDLDPDNAEKVAVLDEVLAGTSADVPFVTTRGMPIEGLLGEDIEGLSAEDIEARLLEMVGTEITDPGYVSTSFDPNVAGTIAGAGSASADYPELERSALVLKVHVPEGGKGLYVKGIGEYDFEEEVLLPRSTPMTIAGVSVVNSPPRITPDGEAIPVPPTYVIEVDAGDPPKDLPIPTRAIPDPITEIGAEDLTKYIRSFNGPRPGNWRELKSWSPSGGPALTKYSYNPEGINEKLRAGDLTPEDAAFADELSAHIAKARTEKDHTVFRGMTASAMLGDIPEGDMDAAAKALVGETISDSGFLSTTVDSHNVDEFMYNHEGSARVGDEVSGVLLRIEVPRGARGGATVSTAYQEEEVLYDRNTELRIKGVTKLPSVKGREKPVYVFNAEMVTPDVAEDETPPVLQEVTKFTGHDKTAPFDGLEAHLVETSRDGTVFSGFHSGAIVGRDYPRDSEAEEALRKLIGEEIELPEGASVTASPSEALEAAAVRPGRYYKPGESSQVAMKINLPEGVDEIPEGATMRVVGVEKSQPPQMRRSPDPYTPNYPAEPPTFVVEVDVVPSDTGQELSRTAEKVAADIEAAINGTLTDRIERSILGET